MLEKIRKEHGSSINFMEVALVVSFLLGILLISVLTFCFIYLIFKWIGLEVGHVFNTICFVFNFITTWLILIVIKMIGKKVQK